MSPPERTVRSLRGRKQSCGLGRASSSFSSRAQPQGGRTFPPPGPGAGCASHPRSPHLPRLNWRRAQGRGRAVSLLPAAAAVGTCGEGEREGQNRRGSGRGGGRRGVTHSPRCAGAFPARRPSCAGGAGPAGAGGAGRGGALC